MEFLSRNAMMHFIGLYLLTGLATNACSTQNQATTAASAIHNLYTFQDMITADYLYTHLEFIAHDSLEGRQTGEQGLDIAADYLADYYEEAGFIPIGDNDSYFQYFDLESRTLEQITFRISSVNNGDTTLINESVSQRGEDAPFMAFMGEEQLIRGDLLFAGFGVLDEERNIDNLNSHDLSGSWVMVFEDMPYAIDGDTLFNPGYDNQARFDEIVNVRNAAGLIVIPTISEEEFRQFSQYSSYNFGTPSSMSLDYLPSPNEAPGGYLGISPELAAGLLDLDSAEELANLADEIAGDLVDFKAFTTDTFLESIPEVDDNPVQTQNVVAYFEGSDPDLKDEVVVLTAHYDHVGIGLPDATGSTIFNGADDNGSGTVAMLGIARSLAQAAEARVRPRRSIVFLHVSAEEWGLYGSRYYSDNPIIPIEQTVANINMDMIGRRDQYHIDRDEEDFIYIIGAEIISSDLDSLLHEGNKKSAELDLNMRYNDLDDPNQFYRRSDHWNFGRLEVPFIFFFSGVHEDYHRQGDTIDKVLIDALAKRTRVIYATTLEIANADKRPEVDNEEFIQRTRQFPR